MPTLSLTDEDVFTLQCAVENLRGGGSSVEAAWRIASKLEGLAKRANMASTDALIGEVMKNSGGSANPETVKKVLLAIRGERVSFVDTPKD